MMTNPWGICRSHSHSHPSDIVSLEELLAHHEHHEHHHQHPSSPSPPLLTHTNNNNQMGNTRSDKRKERVLKKSKSRRRTLIGFGCPLLPTCGSLPFNDSDNNNDDDDIVRMEVTLKDSSMANPAMTSSSSSTNINTSTSSTTSISSSLGASTFSSWFCYSPSSTSTASPPRPPPRGYLPVDVGSSEKQRFFVKTSIVNHPSFQTLLQMAKEEFGFDLKGVLTIPCDVLFFQRILSIVVDEATAASSSSPSPGRSVTNTSMSLLISKH